MLYERIKNAGLNAYDLVRLNEANVEAMMNHASTFEENLTSLEADGATFLEYHEERRAWREVSDAISEANYALRNTLNSDFLVTIENNPIADA